MYAVDKIIDDRVEGKRLHINATFPVFAVLILEKPHNTVALEGETVTLACTISDPNGMVTWIKNKVALHPGLKYDLRKNAAFHQLYIHNLVPEDSGTYTCDTGDEQCDVTLTVEGKKTHNNLFLLDGQLKCS